MPAKITAVLGALGLIIILAIGLPVTKPGFTNTQSSASPEEKSAAEKGQDKRTPVVVELFTSEGCSSCPPADQILSWLGDHQPLEGVEIIPLSEHVDYWNRLGWTDPFSSSVFSARQREYSDSQHGEVYTPQMVVNGKVEFVGSNGDQALKVISNELHAPRATVRIEPIIKTSTSSNLVSFSVKVERLPPLDKKKKGVVFLAVTEDHLESSVAHGENSGRTLAHTGVVRTLKVIGQIETRPAAAFAAQPSVEISKGWKRKDLRAVVFVQLQGSHQILGASVTRFPSL